MRLVTTFIFFLLISGCASLPQQDEQPAQWSADRYYNEARTAQESSDYNTALKYLAELEALYPTSPVARYAPLETAYAYYKLEQFDAAISASSRFINAYPNHSSLDYAYYLKGLAKNGQYQQISTQQTASATGIQDTQLREAFSSFAIVVQQFPNSRYQKKARQFMKEIRNQLADNEFQRLKATLDAGERESALQMAKYISEQYPETPAATKAFEHIIQASSVTITPEATQTNNKQTITVTDTIEGIRHEPWLLQQNPLRFTLQIIGTSSKENLEDYIKRHNLEEHVAYFRSQFRNADWYTLLYGNYATKAEASLGAQRLKTDIDLDSVWIRQFDGVQNQIKNPVQELIHNDKH